MSAPVQGWCILCGGLMCSWLESRPGFNPLSNSPPKPHPPTPHPLSQSFSQSYGSILPTSLTYIVLSTRGYTPWRPAAVMSTTSRKGNLFPWIFKDHQERTRHRVSPYALPQTGCFSSQTDSATHPRVNKKRKLFPELLLVSPGSLASPPTLRLVLEY